MENLSAHFLLIAPEIILLLSGVISLIYGVLFKKINKNFLYYNALLTSFSALLFLILSPIKSTIIFNGMMAITPLTQYGKCLLILSSIPFYYFFNGISQSRTFMVYETIPLFLFSVVGMMMTVSANSFLSLYLALELMTLSIYILVAINRDSEYSSEASVKYFIMGSLSSCIYLLGASLLYGATGHLDFVSIRDVGIEIQQLDYSEFPVLLTIFISGMVLILISFAFKISAAPFYMWAPDVYQGAPWITTFILSSAPKIAGLFALSRLLYAVFIPNDFHWLPIVTIFSAASMVIGAIGAIMQRNIKRIIAYSSIGHIGFALMGLIVSNEEGVEGFIVYITIYITMIIGLFACLFYENNGDDDLDDISMLSGLSKTSPYIAMFMSVLMLSMAGIPPMAGFFAKFYIIYAAIKRDMVTISIIAICSSVLASYYYLRFIKIMYFDDRSRMSGIRTSNSSIAIAAAMVIFNLLYIVFPSHIIVLAKVITKSIFDI
jgi:NADH-quinone oxidoreductase subunit N